MSRTLSAPVTVAFDYTRSTGPVLGRFFGGLRDGRLLAAKLSDESVVIPPPEFDPVTHAPVTDFVEVSPVGTVTSWTWVPEPVDRQPFDRPFAFALVQLDGATAPLLHALDVSSPEEVRTGMRVRVRWAAERVGHINDIICFEPAGDSDEGADAVAGSGRARALPTEEAASEQSRHPAPDGNGLVLPDPVTGIVTPVSLDYVYAASPEESAFYLALEEGRLIGQRCPECGKVYVPPRSACPADGTPTTDEVELSDTGTVTTFCVVNVPFLGQKITPPYVSAYVLLDGADIAFLHLILDIPAEEVRMGMRVKAVWKPREEWGTTIENISHFAPTGEPDADYDTYKHHL
ncbi:Zn-ribbon domain-containing OB-fold protein [Nocardioides massiliensis]|uniref:OB-fold protein n=1 Tax=Nocardioides massiliensis TaxID=1325935 RepID=A0ABT9NRV4_9ACTN|nr:OB-fold nucleic acid binding domain-containing protein [Nocardioides massiliensis]MDP9823151.1 putative OB-fold protein [Nocardioides massiliensis]